MPKAIFVPTLSEDSWVNSPELMGDYLLSHFFVSDFSQTQLYVGSISSLPYIIHKYQNDITGLLGSIQSTLQIYLSKYFDNVVVEATAVQNTTKSTDSGFTLYISYLGSDGKEYTLSRLVETLNSKISNIIKINNG